jgi:hypothetical protein
VRTSLLGEALELLKHRPGGAQVCITRALQPGDTRAATRLSSLIGSYATRHGVAIAYESFTAVTSQGRPIVGVIVTRAEVQP